MTALLPFAAIGVALWLWWAHDLHSNDRHRIRRLHAMGATLVAIVALVAVFVFAAYLLDSLIEVLQP